MIECKCGTCIVPTGYNTGGNPLRLDVFAKGKLNSGTRAYCPVCLRSGRWAEGDGYMAEESAKAHWYMEHGTIKS